MSHSTTIVIRNLTTGAGIGGLAVTVKNHLDGFTAVIATASEVSGKTGVYELIDLPLAKYKVYIAGTEDPSFGGTHGRWLPIIDGLPSLAGTNVWAGTNSYSTEKTLSDAKEFTYKSWVEAAITTLSNLCAKLGGLNVFTSDNNFNGNVQFLGAAPLTPSDPVHNNSLTRKSWIDTTIAAAIAALSALCAKLAGNNTFSGANTFSNDVLFSYGEPPRIFAAPVRATAAANKSYVDSEITARINSFAPGTFQESGNIIRLIPNGTQETDKVYTSWALALANAISRSPSATKQFTILLTGEGTSASDFAITAYEVSEGVFKFMVDYVHLRGLGADVKCTFAQGNILSTQWEAGALGRIVVEDIFFCDDDSDTGNTGEFENIIFKNCKFDIRTAIQLTFTGCKFEGNCEFVSYADNQYTFTNCTGSPITIDAHTVSVGGTNKIPFVGQALAKLHTPLEVTDSLILTGFDNVKPSKAAVTVAEGFGTVSNGIVLAEPDEWIHINKDGTIYAVPLYIPSS